MLRETAWGDGSPETSSQCTRRHRCPREVAVAVLRKGWDTQDLLLLLLASCASSAVPFVPWFGAIVGVLSSVVPRFELSAGNVDVGTYF